MFTKCIIQIIHEIYLLPLAITLTTINVILSYYDKHILDRKRRSMTYVYNNIEFNRSRLLRDDQSPPSVNAS